MFSRRFRVSAALPATALLLLLGVRLPVRAQSSAAPPSVETPGHAFDPQEPIPFDRTIRTARLPNGLTYFVRRNSQPANRVSLRLAVRAGSIEEATDEQGLAHLIEHMAFEGSRHFKPGEVLSYFES